MKTIDYQLVREIFFLSEKSPTGLVWNWRPISHFKTESTFNAWNTKFALKNAGSLVNAKNGYICWSVRVNKVSLLCHRIVWMLHNDSDIPDGYFVDHKDGVRANNHPSNLRLATPVQNQANSKIRIDNSIRIKGVSVNKKSPNKFSAYVQHNNIKIYLGSFDSGDDAANAYNKKSQELNKDFFCNNR